MGEDASLASVRCTEGPLLCLDVNVWQQLHPDDLERKIDKR